MNKIKIDSDELGVSKVQLPYDGLSEGVCCVIDSVVSTLQCSRDMVITAMFTTVGTAIGKRLAIYDGKYHNYPCLWCCNVAPSGSNKSTPVRFILQPLRNVDAANYKTYQNELKEYRKSKSEDNTDKPKFKQILISDSTPEARSQVLANNPNGILLYRDEIKGFLDDIGRYTRSGEVSQLLSMFDSDDISINRKSEDVLLIEKPFMSIFGTIQPEVLEGTFGSDLLMSNGFNQRWLFCYPDSVPPPMYSEKSIPKEIVQSWENFIKGLLAFDFSSMGGELLIMNEAKQRYVEYYNSLQLKKVDADGYMSAVYSKLQIQVLRWAGITHILGNNSSMSRILPEEIEYSIRCMDYFEKCAEKVYSRLSRSKKQLDTKSMTKEQVIAMCYNSFDCKNKAEFANVIGISRPAVSRAVNKYPLLRCYGNECNNNSDDSTESGIIESK